MGDKLASSKLVACPTCGVRMPRTLTVCPRDGTPLPAGGEPVTPDSFDPAVAQEPMPANDLPAESQDADPAVRKTPDAEQSPEAPDSTEAASQDIVVLRDGVVLDNRYEIISLLGLGGMGSVYKARHTVLDTIFAIKIVHPQKISTEAMQRFKLEAQAVSRLKHPNIVGIHDYGITPEGIPYIAMEYLEGKTLSAILREEGTLSRDRFFKIFAQVCDALSLAHKEGIIHRDLKPANILIHPDAGGQDLVKIVDFGMAKLLPRADEPVPVRITATGEVLGSPLYMSPEQCCGRKLDERTDIYSLGILMHEALTGGHVFESETPSKVMTQHVNDPPAFRAKVAGEKELQEIVLKCLKKDPADRYQSAEELRQALECTKSGRAPAVRSSVLPRRAIVVIAIAVAVILMGIALTTQLVRNMSSGNQRHSSYHR